MPRRLVPLTSPLPEAHTRVFVPLRVPSRTTHARTALSLARSYSRSITTSAPAHYFYLCSCLCVKRARLRSCSFDALAYRPIGARVRALGFVRELLAAASRTCSSRLHTPHVAPQQSYTCCRISLYSLGGVSPRHRRQQLCVLLTSRRPHGPTRPSSTKLRYRCFRSRSSKTRAPTTCDCYRRSCRPKTSRTQRRSSNGSVALRASSSTTSWYVRTSSTLRSSC